MSRRKPKFTIQERDQAPDVRARRIRRTRLRREAKSAIDLVKATGVGDNQCVVMLVFDPAEGDIEGYVNADPVLAALALIDYLEKKYPRRKAPPRHQPQP